MFANPARGARARGLLEPFVELRNRIALEIASAQSGKVVFASKVRNRHIDSTLNQTTSAVSNSVFAVDDVAPALAGSGMKG